MPKIFLFESGSTGWSGSFKSFYYIVKALKRKGYSVLVGYINRSDYWKKLDKENVATEEYSHNFYKLGQRDKIHFKILRNIDGQIKKWLGFLSLPISIDELINSKFISEIKKTLQDQKINLVHTNTSLFRDIEILKAASELCLPVVCHLRGDPYRKLTLTEKKMVRYKKVSFVAVSKAMKNKWTRAGLPGEKIIIIYNAQPQLSPEIDKESEIDLNINKSVKLLYVGRLSKIKGVDVLIKSLSKIKKDRWRLDIVGDGPEKKYIEKLVKKHQLSNRVTLYGYQEKLDRFYSKHDVVIVPSFKESFGRVVIEAMQFGIPVIASNIDGPSEIIENGKDGILFEMGNEEALAKNIEFLIKNPEKRKEIGFAGKEKQKLFSEEIFMEKLEKVYNNLLNLDK